MGFHSMQRKLLRTKCIESYQNLYEMLQLHIYTSVQFYAYCSASLLPQSCMRLAAQCFQNYVGPITNDDILLALSLAA